MRREDCGACFKNNEKDDGMRVVLSSAALMLSAAAAAEEFDYEVFAGFDGSNTETSFSPPQDLFPFPVGSSSEIESDIYSAGFRWYLDGLSDEIGPRDRAAFTNRASFAQFAVLTGTVSESGAFFPADPVVQSFSTDFDVTGYALSGRKVFENWFFTGQVSTTEIDFFAASRDQTLVTAGVGRYIGETTALSLTALRVSTEQGSFDDVDSGLQLEFTHVGDVAGSGWQYAVDLAASNESFENSNGQYSAGLTLYPTKNFGFGVTVDDQLGESDNDAVRWSLGANWFVTPSLQFEFAAGSTTFDDPEGVDTDSNQYSIQARYRF
ncbi:MAG: hypothetical protein AAGL69_00440 [Pseudomonadota bacterium]